MKDRGKGNEWLLLKKKDDFADPEWDAEQHSRSVLTGRTQEEIARDMPAVPAAHHAKRTYPKGAVKAAPPSSVTPMKGVLGALPRGRGLALRSEMGRRARDLLHRDMARFA